ncbi:pirin family protein [Sulfurovum sp. zt1-1]|uniref:Pirin family protein n=1 Tax=Sulfurovum zhangzhouensis TaxID=3019067 RepID=A0ABT7QYE6_9BACT|nr:pirin family protein [Sulfurovum zhangzhouensis]MDM5271850.1 pirin family protein [Sulfurovum zhangzhouensis]
MPSKAMEYKGMLVQRPKKKMGKADHGWLQSNFHFSFAEYYNPHNIHFGVLRVLNDDTIQPQSGFPTHPHRDMEIITYIISGELTHKDSMGNEERLGEGEVQYMSAGTGITHSEYNLHPDKTLKLLQIWIFPPEKNIEPLYGSYRFAKKDAHNTLLNIVSSQTGDAPIKIFQDVKIFISRLDKDRDFELILNQNRQIYFVLIEGSAEINGLIVQEGDGLEIVDEPQLIIKALSNAHFLFIEMPSSHEH